MKLIKLFLVLIIVIVGCREQEPMYPHQVTIHSSRSDVEFSVWDNGQLLASGTFTGEEYLIFRFHTDQEFFTIDSIIAIKDGLVLLKAFGKQCSPNLKISFFFAESYILMGKTNADQITGWRSGYTPFSWVSEVNDSTYNALYSISGGGHTLYLDSIVATGHQKERFVEEAITLQIGDNVKDIFLKPVQN